ncbi:MAPK/MAK/MRK overlapping kinase [Anopheles gambiae]|uniref:MAPK/MAK/MRK overlapping kinase n=1 Tax=Anopheles gambiae TaxID=7165 RepID=UPI002AC962EA|nr:MAPK/MAK/MRK overlapping kinase [Anopheles gambiae]
MSTFKITGYDIIHQIGSGAYSEVFLVRCRKSGKSYAAKHLIDCCSDLMCDVAYAEIQLMKSVPSHPNVMQLCDHVLENKSLTLIMHLMDINLYEYMQKRVRPFSENRVRKMLYQIVLGLEHLHQNGIFHRDVKPENILVKFSSGIIGKRETLQLADFGTAATIAQRPPYAIYIATRWYRAPECMLSMGYYGPKMDVWAVGCCFYEMLTLKPLFQGENEIEMLDCIHELLGSPSSAVLERFRPWNVKNLKFAKRQATELRWHLPLMNVFGMDLMKKMLAYCPDQRLSSKNVANHTYFEELIRHKKLSKFSLSHQSLYNEVNEHEMKSCAGQLRNKTKHQHLMPDSSVASVQSFKTNNTFHFLSPEEQTKINKQRERFWNMNPKSIEHKLWCNEPLYRREK